MPAEEAGLLHWQVRVKLIWISLPLVAAVELLSESFQTLDHIAVFIIAFIASLLP